MSCHCLKISDGRQNTILLFAFPPVRINTSAIQWILVYSDNSHLQPHYSSASTIRKQQKPIEAIVVALYLLGSTSSCLHPLHPLRFRLEFLKYFCGMPGAVKKTLPKTILVQSFDIVKQGTGPFVLGRLSSTHTFLVKISHASRSYNVAWLPYVLLVEISVNKVTSSILQ